MIMESGAVTISYFLDMHHMPGLCGHHRARLVAAAATALASSSSPFSATRVTALTLFHSSGPPGVSSQLPAAGHDP